MGIVDKGKKHPRPMSHDELVGQLEAARSTKGSKYTRPPGLDKKQ